MKNLSIIINVGLLLAVAVLYFLHFAGKSPDAREDSAIVSDTTMPEKISIVYINEDSLLEKYEFFKELASKLEQKRKNLESDYTSKAQGLQTEITNFQRNAGNMTISQARAVEEDLMRKQQNLVRYQETLGQDMLKEETDVNRQLFEKVSGFLEEYAEINGYTVVLNYKPGSALLYGHQAMDVTKEVVSGLNEAYRISKNPGQTQKQGTAKSDTASTN